MLQAVTTNFYQVTVTGTFNEPFNQATFFNYDTTTAITINDFIVPAAVTTAGVTVPAFFEISLNTEEYNVSQFKIDLKGSSTPNCLIIWTKYVALK